MSAEAWKAVVGVLAFAGLALGVFIRLRRDPWEGD